MPDKTKKSDAPEALASPPPAPADALIPVTFDAPEKKGDESGDEPKAAEPEQPEQYTVRTYAAEKQVNPIALLPFVGTGDLDAPAELAKLESALELMKGRI